MIRIYCALTFFFIFLPLSAHSDFISKNDFIAHTQNESTCTSGDCHQKTFSGKKTYQHAPAAGGECSVCHKANRYPNTTYGLEFDQRFACATCHTRFDRAVQASDHVHTPVKEGNCSFCHDPHESDERHLLKLRYDTLCSSCHVVKKLFAGKYVHKPVIDGNCGFCHDPHASDQKAQLTDVGANLCLSCHEDMILNMTQNAVHAPLLERGCTDCHDPHSGDSALRLTLPSDRLCYRCHEEKRNEIRQYADKHQPAAKGQCTTCHSPHFSSVQTLLRDRLDNLCYRCHEKSRKWREKRFPHGPVVQGNCSVCHNPHGSDNAFILRLSFPHTFYSPYEKGKYDLCFLCHKESLLLYERTVVATNFRNGDANLHWLHVNQKKGRTCRACHDVHASDQEGRIREEFPFGNAMIPMYYFKTENGGRCIPGCHRERSYDRKHPMVNEN